jgi:uncharacterized membrane protein YhhN
MQLFKKNGIIIFWAVLFADCFFLYNENYAYHGYLKAALVPVLLLYIFMNARKKHYLVSKSLIFMGMLFSWIGDLLLLNDSNGFDNNGFFMWGMFSFFIAHVFYIIFFFRLHPLNLLKATEAILAAIVLGVVGYQLYKFLHLELIQMPNLRIFLLGYGSAIALMAILATNVFANKSKRSLAVSYFMPGAALFIFSDIILVISKFKYPDESYLHVVTVMAYGYAQCLLAQGFNKHLKG